jgi:hypothetical protein
MRASILFFRAVLLGCVICSCGPRSPEENPEDADPGRAAETAADREEWLESSPFDSTITIIDDLTADGEPDSLELRVVGSRMEDPFEWTVRIWVRGVVVFEHEMVDSLIDGRKENEWHEGRLGLTEKAGAMELTLTHGGPNQWTLEQGLPNQRNGKWRKQRLQEQACPLDSRSRRLSL